LNNKIWIMNLSILRLNLIAHIFVFLIHWLWLFEHNPIVNFVKTFFYQNSGKSFKKLFTPPLAWWLSSHIDQQQREWNSQIWVAERERNNLAAVTTIVVERERGIHRSGFFVELFMDLENKKDFRFDKIYWKFCGHGCFINQSALVKWICFFFLSSFSVVIVTFLALVERRSKENYMAVLVLDEEKDEQWFMLKRFYKLII